MDYSYIIILFIALVILMLIYAVLKFFDVKIIKEKITTKQITGAAVLSAVEIVLIVMSNYVAIGPVNLNLSLVPIAVGAMLYGPLVGGFLGLINGAITLISPSTLAVFMPISPIGTVLVCLLKTGLAGLIAGFVFKLFKNHKVVGTFIASILVPIINTGLFCLGSYLFFTTWLNAGAVGYDNTFMFLLFAVIGWNFLIEMAIPLILSPTIYGIVRYFERKRD